MQLGPILVYRASRLHAQATFDVKQFVPIRDVVWFPAQIAFGCEGCLGELDEC